eukprot:361612-Chlamydomonas_euryale.AAC.25
MSRGPLAARRGAPPPPRPATTAIAQLATRASLLSPPRVASSSSSATTSTSEPGWRTDFSEQFRVQHLLGKGSYGTVSTPCGRNAMTGGRRGVAWRASRARVVPNAATSFSWLGAWGSGRMAGARVQALRRGSFADAAAKRRWERKRLLSLGCRVPGRKFSWAAGMPSLLPPQPGAHRGSRPATGQCGSDRFYSGGRGGGGAGRACAGHRPSHLSTLSLFLFRPWL